MGKAGGLLVLILAGVMGAAFFLTRNPASVSAAPIEKIENAEAAQPAAPLTDRKIDSEATQSLGTTRAPGDEFTPAVHEVLNLAGRLDQTNPETATEIDEKLEKISALLTLADATQLQAIAIAPNRSHNSRYLAVYLLSERPEIFAHQLEEIAGSDSEVLGQKVQAHSQAEEQRHFEEALHAQALGGLDRLNKIDNREKPFFNQLQETHSNPFVRKLARMGAVGADQHLALINQYTHADR